MVFQEPLEHLYEPTLITPVLLRRQDSFLPINHLGKRHAKTAKMPVEFDLSFTGPETASFRPRGQKPRVYSLGVNRI